MKIAIVGTRGFPQVQGGVEKHCEYLAVNLVKQDCDVTVFTRKPYVNPTAKYYKGVKLVALPATKIRSLEAFLHTFVGVLTAFCHNPDILHLQAIGPGLFTPLAKLLGMNVVVTSHGSNYEHLKWGKFAKIVLKIGERLGVCLADQTISVSEKITEEIKAKYNKGAITIPNGVVIQKRLESAEALAKFGLTKGKYILSVGRLVPEKGFEILIDAFQKLNLNDWKLVIAGKADHEDEYSRNLKKSAAANSNIILTGFITGKSLQEIYSHAGLFVLSSFYEGLPIVLLEALGYGLSCLASDIKGNRNLPLTEARFFRAGDTSELAVKIKRYINRPLSETEKQKQIDLIAERYDWERIARETKKVYLSCLAEQNSGLELHSRQS